MNFRKYIFGTYRKGLDTEGRDRRHAQSLWNFAVRTRRPALSTNRKDYTRAFGRYGRMTTIPILGK